MKHIIRAIIASIICLGFAAVLAPGPSVAYAATLPAFGHVVIVVEENHGYSQTVGSAMPYLTSLYSNTAGLVGSFGGLATNYFADTHPSIGNYFVLTAGQILSNQDGDTPGCNPQSADNIALEAQNAGKTWKAYAENLPSGIYTCGYSDPSGFYIRHVPLAYFTNINQSNVVDFSQFSTDLKNNALPNFSFITPNGGDDAHDGSLSKADSWLKSNIGQLLASKYFQAGGDGLLIVVFDEDGCPSCSGAKSTGTGAGGQVEWVAVSPSVKNVTGGATSSGSYEHENALATMAQGLGLNISKLGAAATAAPMSDFFTTVTSGSVTLTPSSLPFGNQTLSTTATQTLSLANGTLSPVSVGSPSISPTGAFGIQSNGCISGSLAANSSCSIVVAFTPSAITNYSATLSLTAGTSNFSVPLSGAGVASTVTVSPSSLPFGIVAVGSSSMLSSTLTNNGSSALTITSAFTISPSGGPFAFNGTGTCPPVGSTIAPGGNCRIDVKFAPTATGSFTGTVSVNDSAGTQTISLSGTGGSGSGGGSSTATVSPTSMSFGNTKVGTVSAFKTATLINNSTSTALTIGSIAISPNFQFAAGGTCGSTLGAGASCSINVEFAPTTTGTLTGSVTISDTASNTPQTISLSGHAKGH
jgi:phosphoesterase family protein/HYDIN/CFA65/VesB family protein/centrosomal CEP192-like protein